MSNIFPLLIGSNQHRSCWLLTSLALTIFSVGCEKNARGLTLNAPKAREACTSFLSAWKEGKKAGDLAPKIVGKDADWETGGTLESFEILPTERSDGANLFMQVRRTVKTPKGGMMKEEVGYVVCTSPVVTVFRSDH